MFNASLLVKADAKYFVGWLEHYADRFNNEVFQVDPNDKRLVEALGNLSSSDVSISIGSATHWNPAQPSLDAFATYVVDPLEDPPLIDTWPIGEVITFHPTRLDTERFEIQILWWYPSVAGYVDSLVGAICERWPDTRILATGTGTPEPNQEQAIAHPLQEASTFNGTQTETDNPWEGIKEQRDKEMVKMWWQHRTKTEIAKRYGLRPRSVENIFWRLRKRYGDEVVPVKQALPTET